MQLDFGKPLSSAGSGFPHAKNKWKHLAQTALAVEIQPGACVWSLSYQNTQDHG